MSFGVLGCHDLHGNGGFGFDQRPGLRCAKTFPAFFFDVLESLRQASLRS
ncbi:MAG: hypothetical protein R3F03_03905 [Opitutaceae bacterium]